MVVSLIVVALQHPIELLLVNIVLIIMVVPSLKFDGIFYFALRVPQMKTKGKMDMIMKGAGKS